MSEHHIKAEKIGQLDKFIDLVQAKKNAGLAPHLAEAVALNQIEADLTALEDEAVMADRRATQVEAFAAQSVKVAEAARANATELRARADKEAKKRATADKARAKAAKNSEAESDPAGAGAPEDAETETNAKA